MLTRQHAARAPVGANRAGNDFESDASTQVRQSTLVSRSPRATPIRLSSLKAGWTTHVPGCSTPYSSCFRYWLCRRQGGVRFLAVDLPEANDLTVGIMALVAQVEREAISRRTKEALAVAKASGVKLGNPKGGSGAQAGGAGVLRSGQRWRATPTGMRPICRGGGSPEPAGDGGLDSSDRAPAGNPDQWSDIAIC